MPLQPDFPTDPYVILDPSIRWYPGDAMLAEMGYEMLLPPLVHKVRRGVKAWRDSGYEGASTNDAGAAESLVPHRAYVAGSGRHACGLSGGISPNGRRSNRRSGSMKSSARAILTPC